MAFCNRCGATLADGTKFCNKCGAPIAGAPAASAAPGTSTSASPAGGTAPTGGSNALKVVLIVVGVIVLVGILGLAAVTMIGIHIAKNSRLQQKGDNVKVETPFGTFSANDPDQAVKDLGIEMYPGAQVQKNGSASIAIGSMRTVTAVLETGDPVEKVCAFYQSRLPAASVKTSDRNYCSIASNDPKNAITVNIQASGSVTRIQIASVRKDSGSSDQSNKE